jgi:hypothetical protein
MSTSTRAGLQMLKEQLERRQHTIKRAGGLTKISFSEVYDQFFLIYVWWKDGEAVIRMTHDSCFEMKGTEPRLKLRPCQIVWRIIQRIHTERGV